MSKRERLSGNEAASLAIRQIDPDVIAAFPITPSTEIPQYISQYIANGQMTTEFVTVESEHSAISACMGAEAAGIRAMTATSSCGLALMHEILYVTASNRLPMVMVVANRALTGPINIHNDHSDAMASRDAGWIQIYSENAQEVYDNVLMAHRIAENKKVCLPVMICQDGFITSHAVENLLIEEDELVKKFVGEYHPDKYLLNPTESLSIGPFDMPCYYMEHKRQQDEAMFNAKKVICDVADDFAKTTGRQYSLFEEYCLDDAETCVVVMGSSAGTAKAAIDELRAKGRKVGLLKLRVFRPFPAEELAEALKNMKAVAIFDKADSFAADGGPLGAELRSALYCAGVHPFTIDYIYGLGGRDVTTNDFFEAFGELDEALGGKKLPNYRFLNTRE